MTKILERIETSKRVAQTAVRLGLAAADRLLWYCENAVMSARFIQWARSLPKDVRRQRLTYWNREELWRDAVIPELESSSLRIRCMEFGVASGAATSWWMRSGLEFAKWDGFDTFEGLPEEWSRGGTVVVGRGAFATEHDGSGFPSVDARCDLEWHKGLIEETLLEQSRSNDETLLVLVDVDLRSPAELIVEWMVANYMPGDVIYFDEALDPFNEGAVVRDLLASGVALDVLGVTGTAVALRFKQQ